MPGCPVITAWLRQRTTPNAARSIPANATTAGHSSWSSCSAVLALRMMAPRLLLAPAELASVLSIGEWPNVPARGTRRPRGALTFVPVLPVCGAGAAPTRGAESMPKAGITTRIAGAACVWHRRCDVGGGEDKPSCPVVTNAPTRGAQQELLVLLVCGIGAVPPLLVAVPASAPRDHRPRVVQRRGEACWCNHQAYLMGRKLKGWPQGRSWDTLTQIGQVAL